MQLYRCGLWFFLGQFLVQLLIPPATFGASTALLKEHQQLKEREQQIVGQLLQLELAVDQAHREYQQVEARLAQTQSQIPQAQAQLGQARQDLKVRQQKLGLWLRHYYMEGQTHYLLIFLGATNLKDFVQRLSLVGLIIAQGIEDWRETRVALQTVDQKNLQLQKVKEQLVSQRQKMAAILRQAQERTAERQRYLQEVRQELGQREAGVLLVVEGIHTALQPLETVLTRFKDASWDQIRPDRLQWLGSRVKAEYSENTLSRLLFSGASLPYPVSVQLGEGVLILQGTNQEQIPFRIAGVLRVSGSDVCFKPSAIELGDMTLSQELVTKIGGSQGLVYPVGTLMGWKLQEIFLQRGKAVFELATT